MGKQKQKFMRYKHIDGVKVTAQFTPDRKYRYRLVVTHKSRLQGKTACVIMMNPSYANEQIADKSVQFMEKIVFEKGLPEFRRVRRLIVVNLFAYIQTNKFEGLDHEIGVKNNSAIKSAFKKSDIIITGWGASERFRDRVAFVSGLRDKITGKKWFRTKKHPSRAGYKGFILPGGIF